MERRISVVLLAAIIVCSACTSAAVDTTPPTLGTTTSSSMPLPSFDVHTAHRLSSVDEYFALARAGVTNQSVVKFSIPDIHNNAEVHWMDSNFYQLHDEWYWFQLLNGIRIVGVDTEPVRGLSFETVHEVYTWAETQPAAELPLDLRFVNSRSFGRRLYSPRFYNLALHADPRTLGVGSLVHFAANDASDGDRWLMELEYSDDVTATDVELFFDRLIPTLPDEIGSNLEWVIRSPHQNEIAQKMEAESLPYGDRVVRYDDIVPRGEVAVYNEGIAAGRLLLVDEDGADLTDTKDTDILIMENVPDWLPPGSALITSSPQTPLAHVNLLARNRGIPNASRAGVLDDAQIHQAARVRAPAIVRASGTDELEIVLITDEQYDEWLSRQTRATISVPPVDIDSTPLVVFLDSAAADIRTESDIEALRPVIGGKSAGFLTLLAADGVTTPERPLAITVRPYFEHLETVHDALDAMLDNRDFRSSSSARFLLLEGREEFDDNYSDPADISFADSFEAEHPPGTLIGEILDAGGFKDYFRDAPLDESTLSQLTSILADRYGSYAPTQGLRFRSSSSVEDIEGFSGAGLYDSNTGFLDPDAQPDENDHKKSIERTIKKTWASYWSFEAYEERRRERVDHLSGGMGVLVHARFDDPLELNNGVATLSLLPDNSDEFAVVAINVQLGDESVTNPDPLSGELPEVITVRVDRQGNAQLDRMSASTLSPDSEILSEAAVTELVAQLESVAILWRNRVNASLPPEQRIETVTLDYEFKTMAPGWPAMTNGELRPSRLVVKQARSLDPGLRDIPDRVLELPVPRDVLARARSVARVDCGDSERIEVLTDPLLPPDIGYAESPFIVGEIDLDQKDCEREVLYSTPDEFLLELLRIRTRS
ncbi:MAG: PEP/pyruvate-binding domain-containing protein [Acidimicrobiales bacterium]